MLAPEIVEELIAAAVYAEAWFTSQECVAPDSLDYRAFQAADKLRGALGQIEGQEDYKPAMRQATLEFEGLTT